MTAATKPNAYAESHKRFGELQRRYEQINTEINRQEKEELVINYQTRLKDVSTLLEEVEQQVGHLKDVEPEHEENLRRGIDNAFKEIGENLEAVFADFLTSRDGSVDTL